MKTTTNIFRTLAKATLAVTLFSIAAGFSEAQKAQPESYSLSQNELAAVNHDELRTFRTKSQGNSTTLFFRIKTENMVRATPVDSESASPMLNESTLEEELIHAAGIGMKSYRMPEENTESMNSFNSSELENEMAAAAGLYTPPTANPYAETEILFTATEKAMTEAAQLYTPAAGFDDDSFSGLNETSLENTMIRAAGLPFKPQSIE